MTPPPTAASLVRNVAQGLRMTLEAPDHAGRCLVLSRHTLQRWLEQLMASLLLAEQEHRRGPREGP